MKKRQEKIHNFLHSLREDTAADATKIYNKAVDMILTERYKDVFVDIPCIQCGRRKPGRKPSSKIL